MTKERDVTMEYEGDLKDLKSLICIWYMDGKEVYRHKYTDMTTYAALCGVRFEVRERIIRWAKMIHNPD